MAKAAGAERGSRSKAIRDYLKEHPSASPKEVVAGLKEQGVEVKEGLVGNIKYSLKGKSKGRRIRRGSGSAVAVSVGRRGSRSQAVRDYLQTNPSAGPAQIVEELKKQGIKISAALASQVKYKKRGRKAPRMVRRSLGSARVASGGGISATDLIQAKKLTDALGGIDNVRKALALLEQLA